MYCDNCHRQSPDNFVNCPYCSAPLKKRKRRKPQKFVRKKERKKPISFKGALCISVCAAVVLGVCAVATGILTGKKPDTAVSRMVDAINTDNSSLFYSLYDDQLLKYYKDNWYYTDEETFAAVTEPLRASREFYASKCGEDFKIELSITKVRELSDEESETCSEMLVTAFDYEKLPSRIAYVNFEVAAKGELGEYKSVYEYFVCIKLKGKWYIQPAAAEVFEAVLTEE